MAESMTGSPLTQRYSELIDEIVQMTLKGKIRAKEQVYQLIRQGVALGTGEIFERCLGDRLSTSQDQVNSATDELKQAKAARSLRALQTIQGEWQRAQSDHQSSESVAAAVQAITTAESSQRLTVLLQTLDPNANQLLSAQQLKQLATALQKGAETEPELQQLSAGISAGLESWQRLENHLVSWIYNQGQAQLGFTDLPGQRGPWAVWAAQMQHPLPKIVFQSLALNQPLHEAIARQPGVDFQSWVELVVILQYLQRGLVGWFDKMVYNAEVGSKLSISTFLVFASLWSQLAEGFSRNSLAPTREHLQQGCFQITQQILRTFTQREYFPLYGGVFASFTGNYLRDTLNYLDAPLRQVDGTQEKARVLTLLGYSLQAQGRLPEALAYHEQALAIAREAGDSRCEIANLNHLSRSYGTQKNYPEATAHSQRALILSRQAGDRLGEANALANLGYSEVFSAHQLKADSETYEMAIHYLQQGLQLAQQLGDGQSQALCYSSLGIAHIVLSQPQAAIAFLGSGWQAAQFSGDLYQQGLNLAYLAEAYYSLQNHEKAVATGCLGMYLLEQIAASEWRQPAGLLTILQGQLGEIFFQKLLAQQRSQIIPIIGVDGYDHIPQILEQYQQVM